MFTFRPRGAFLPLLAAAGIAVAGTAYANPGSSSGHGHTITLREASASVQPAFVDIGKPGPSAGDQVVVRDGLVTADGAAAGTIRQACTLIDAGANPFVSTYECSSSLELADGTITLAGPFVPAKAEQAAAVTGGTGAYRAARGEAIIRSEADEIVVELAGRRY
jgi:hypothetical protein